MVLVGFCPCYDEAEVPECNNCADWHQYAHIEATEKTLQESSQNKEANLAGILDDATASILDAIFQPASVEDVKSSLLE